VISLNARIKVDHKTFLLFLFRAPAVVSGSL